VNLAASQGKPEFEVPRELCGLVVFCAVPLTRGYRKYSVSQKQDAQLSQRDRSMVRVIEYFTKSLKVIGNGINR